MGQVVLVMAGEGPPECVMPTQIGIHALGPTSGKGMDADLRRHDGV